MTVAQAGLRPSVTQVTPARQLGRVVAAEWVKARSVPSTWSALGACVAILAGIGPIISGPNQQGPGAPRSEPLLQMMAGVSMAQVALGVLGALLITAEYSSRSIGGTLAAVLQRNVLLAGKAVLLVVLVTPLRSRPAPSPRSPACRCRTGAGSR